MLPYYNNLFFVKASNSRIEKVANNNEFNLIVIGLQNVDICVINVINIGKWESSSPAEIIRSMLALLLRVPLLLPRFAACFRY